MQKKIVQKTFGAYRAPRVAFPDLVGHQRGSFDWLLTDGLKELFKEFSPITDYSGKKFELEFESFEMNKKVIDSCIEAGVMTDWFLFASNCLRISPPLVIEDEQIKKACEIIIQACDTL